MTDDVIGAMAKAWSTPLWDEAIDTCSRRLFELSEKRPSPGLIDRQNVSEDSISFAQAVLYAASQDLLKLKRGEDE